VRARITGIRLATASAGLFTLVATLATAAPASAAPASAALPSTGSAPAATGVRYVALGDSYAAGLGTGREQGDCDRSPAAYGPQWARAHQPASFTFAACSGATARGIRTHRLGALSPATTLVSVTVGGNDVGFSDVIQTCIIQSTHDCLQAIRGAEHAMTTSLPRGLNRLLAAIRQHAPAAKIVLTGYPLLFDPARPGSCSEISHREQIALNRGANLLDNTIKSAAGRHGAAFADVRAAFRGHAICDGAAWLHGLDFFSLDDSFHPTIAGQTRGYLPAFTAAAR
jgi:lysophospholipase L1-like esterase